jgi:glycosyltransferase involved in cell wall biosynthesis
MSTAELPLVALDLSQVDNQTLGSGQFRYAVMLVGGLAASDGAQLLLFGSTAVPREEFRPALERFPERCRYVQLPVYRGRGYYYYDVLRLSWRLFRHRVDVLHQFHTNIPPLKPCPVVVTGYHYYYDRALFDTRPHRYYRWALRHRADLVITISNATKRDFEAEYGLAPDRMRTVYPGLSLSLVAAAPHRAERPYVMSPYNLSVPKNLRSLVLAWPSIAERHPALELVLYGVANVTEGCAREFDDMVRVLPHGDRIRRVGHLDDPALAERLAGCELFVFPTTVEGFGFPLLEAMANGACCITRNASAMQEVGGDAVCLVETRDPDAIARAAMDLLADGSRRSELGRLARARAGRFTVDAMVQQTLECYRAVMRPERRA